MGEDGLAEGDPRVDEDAAVTGARRYNEGEEALGLALEVSIDPLEVPA
jgi:hypothetical protein